MVPVRTCCDRPLCLSSNDCVRYTLRLELLLTHTSHIKVLESYITHCRVTEDGSSAEPPPLGAPEGNRKARIIMVAVRKSGRVRMHKARENPNGSFSIGKTWNLDDLQSITIHPPPNERGFTVTILKPYYWQANSAKEKDFFISSLVKIYKKYTGGKAPELLGFKLSELDVLLGPGGAQTMARPRQDDVARPPKTPTSTGFSPSPGPPVSRNVSAAQSMESLNKLRGPTQPGQRLPDGKLAAPGLSSLGGVRPMKSSDALPRRMLPEGAPPRLASPPPGVPQGVPVPSNGRRPSDGSSTRSAGSRAPSSTRAPPPQQQRAEDERAMRRAASQERFRSPSVSSQQSQDPRREAMEQYSYPNKSNDFTTSQDNQGPLNKKPNKDVASQFRLAANAYGVGNKLSSPSSRPRTPTTPTYTSSLSREPSNMSSPEPPPAMPQICYPPQESPPSDNVNGNGSAYGRQPSEDGRRPRSVSTSSRDQPPVISTGPPPLEPREPPSRSEVRGRQPPSRENSQTIVPLSSTPQDERTITEPALMIKKPQTPVPTAIVSPPPQEEPLGVQAPTSRQLPLQDGASLQAPQLSRSRSRSPGGRGRGRRTTRTSTYLEGLDKSGLSVDIDELLQEFSWDGQQKIDQLQADVKKELSRVESSNVVVSVDGDDRIGHLSALLDKAIQECEEMDGLLTLYAVELSVRELIPIVSQIRVVLI
jgi:hypothetical protein